MRVLCGGPARETSSDLYRLHCEGLRAQDTSAQSVVVRDGGVNFADVVGAAPGSVIRMADTDALRTVTTGIEVVVRHEVVADSGGPRWSVDKIERVARARQAMMDASDVYDALFLCDTDVIVGPGVLERLWAVDADVVHAVYWTRDDWGQPQSSDVAPQVWWTHPYDWKANDAGAAMCWNALCEPGVNEVEVNGGGACTLIRGRGFESRYWPLLESLKGAGRLWPGEDRTYCLGLECRGIRQVAVTGLPVVHLYDRALQTPAKLAEARELVGLDKPGPRVWLNAEELAESLRT